MPSSKIPNAKHCSNQSSAFSCRQLSVSSSWELTSLLTEFGSFILCSELYCSSEQQYSIWAPVKEKCYCTDVFLIDTICNRKCRESLTTVQKSSLAHLDLMIRNKSVLLSLFIQERLLRSSHETDVIATLEIITVIVFNSDVAWWGWCVQVLRLELRNFCLASVLSKSTSEGEKMVKSWKLLLYPKPVYGLVSLYGVVQFEWQILCLVDDKC